MLKKYFSKIAVLLFILNTIFTISNAQSKKRNQFAGIYGGVYVFPLLAQSERRDYGGTVNFIHKNWGLEASYLKINGKKENVYDLQIKSITASQSDLPRWSGYYTHIQPKYYRGDRFKTYLGLIIGYAEKNFPAFNVDITDNITKVKSTQAFKPHVSSYFAMLNTGKFGLRKYAAMEAYAGFGFHYSYFSNGSNIKKENFYIDNPILRNREDSYYGVMMRLGLVISIGYSKNFEKL